MVVGKTCAGKTTFGQYSRSRYDAHFVDASDVMRSFRDPIADRDLNDYEFAKRLLQDQGPDAVARRVLKQFGEEPLLVVAGFRAIEEISCVRSAFPRKHVVLVEASERTTASAPSSPRPRWLCNFLVGIPFC